MDEKHREDYLVLSMKFRERNHELMEKYRDRVV
jgi:hypothetical protein